MDADIQAVLSTGLGAPTAITPITALYAPPPYNYIDDNTQVGPTPQTLRFDVVVLAANGSTVTLTANVYSANSKYGLSTLAKIIKVGPDAVAPTATTPSAKFVAGLSIASGLVPIRLAWAGTDNLSGVARYELAQSVDGHAYTIVTTTLTQPVAYRNLPTGHTYRYRVRPVDRAGNVGGWVTGRGFTLRGVSQAKSSVHYRGTWATSTSTTWWGGTARRSSTKGSTVSYAFTGRSIAWVGLTGKGRGKARIYVNGVLKATVDLYSSTTHRQRYVWVTNYSTSATRTVLIKVLATSGRPRVDVDGFVVKT
jgi:hypothetical protein